MHDLEKTAREHDQEGSSEDREACNHGSRENALSGPGAVPSAPPGGGFPGLEDPAAGRPAGLWPQSKMSKMDPRFLP